MATAYFCVLMAAVMPFVFAGYAKFSSKGYDNSRPREFLDKLEGKSKRSHFAQLNSFEAFPSFAVSVVIAHLSGVSQSLITVLAVLFVVFRIIYGICYIADKHVLRTIVWTGGLFCVLCLFIESIVHCR